MKKCILLVLWALTALFLLAGCGKKTPAGTWIIAADNDLSPFIYAGDDGKAAGLDAEILEAIAEDQGFRYELRLSDWNTAMGVFTSSGAGAAGKPCQQSGARRRRLVLFRQLL